MLAHTFEIKIALLGNVSAGKTTVLNALFRDNYGEVAMKRTTGCVNFFRIHTKSSDKEVCCSSDSETSAENGDKDSDWMKMIDTPRSAESILTEIVVDNHRSNAGIVDVVQEKSFDIELDEDLISMAKNTRLVVIDIPGINEAGTENKYKDYVSKHWDSFDCVVLVLDCKLDTRTDDQMFLLNFAKENLVKRDVPIIVVGNKVDYNSEAQEELVKIARHQIEQTFNDSSRGVPVFVPMSAIQAYIYQTASHMTFAKFKSFDKLLIEEFGHELVGRVNWRKLSDDEKLEKLYAIVRDPSYYKEGMKECNFLQFLQSLEHLLGGAVVQENIVQEQIKVALDALKSGSHETDIASYLRLAYCNLRLIHGNSNEQDKELWQVFLTAYKSLADSTFGQLEISTTKQNVSILAILMDELISCYRLSVDAGWKDGEIDVLNLMKGLVRRMISYILEQEQKEWLDRKNAPWYEKSNTLSPIDWLLIVQSILLPSYDMNFVKAFGRDVIMIKSLAARPSCLPSYESLVNCTCCGATPNCEYVGYKCCDECKIIYFSGSTYPEQCLKLDGDIQDGVCSACNYTHEPIGQLNMSLDESSWKFIPVNHIRKYVHVDIAECLSDPNHFGHIAWKYCNFTTSIEGK